jgi:hypothetical protein
MIQEDYSEQPLQPLFTSARYIHNTHGIHFELLMPELSVCPLNSAQGYPYILGLPRAEHQAYPQSMSRSHFIVRGNIRTTMPTMTCIRAPGSLIRTMASY